MLNETLTGTLELSGDLTEETVILSHPPEAHISAAISNADLAATWLFGATTDLSKTT